MYKCAKTDCLMRLAERHSRSGLRCEHCEVGRTDASHYIVAVPAAYEAPYRSSRRDDDSSSYSTGSSYSSSSDSSSSSSSSDSFSSGGGDSGGGGSSDSY